MRIISKWQDYYDGGMAYGQDRSITYVRDRTNIVQEDRRPRHEVTQGVVDWSEVTRHVRAPGTIGPKLLSREEPRYRYGWGSRDVAHGCVFFCGKSYPFYVIEKVVKTPRYIGKMRTDHEERTVVFSWDKDFDGLVRQAHVSRDHGPYRDWLDANMGRDNPEVNLQHRSPVVLWMPGGFLLKEGGYGTLDSALIVNPKLAEIGFQKVVDPYTAFQEISMFIGGVLGENLDPPSPMTDKQKVVSHGFDPKYGFRKLPSKST